MLAIVWQAALILFHACQRRLFNPPVQKDLQSLNFFMAETNNLGGIVPVARKNWCLIPSGIRAAYYVTQCIIFQIVCSDVHYLRSIYFYRCGKTCCGLLS